MAATSGNGPLVNHMRPCALRQHVEWMGGNLSSKRIYFLGVLRVCMALKTLRYCGDASLPEQRSTLRAIHTLSPPKKHIRKLGVLSPIHLKRWCGAQGLMWGARGPFLLAAAMVVAVVTPVVFCAKATEKCNKNTKISFLVSIVLFITIFCKTYCSSCIANCSVAQAQVVACPEPKPLWSNWPKHIGYCRKALVIVRTILTLYWGWNVGITKKMRTGCTHVPTTANYLRFFGFFSEWFLRPGGSYAPCSMAAIVAEGAP